jgi:hypothetical protein
MSTPNDNRPPLNFEPADGTYTFRIGKLKETDVRRSAKGTGMVKVAFIAEGGEYVKSTFFATPKALPKAYDLIEAAGAKRPAPGAIKDEFDLANAIQEITSRKVTATIKKGEPREYNGKTYTDYEVNGFKAPF